MLRFIVKNKYKDQYTGLESSAIVTIDTVCDQLETILSAGGFSDTGYDCRELIGVEIIRDKPNAK